MKKLSKLVKDFLDDMGLRPEQTDDEKDFKIGFRGDNGDFSVLITVDDAARRIVVHTACPINVPKERLQAATELVIRRNCNLGLGSFDIDMDDGFTVFRTGMKIGRIDLDSETLLALICGNFWMMDNFLPAIASVVYGNMAPQEAMAMLEDEQGQAKEVPEDSSKQGRPGKQQSADGRTAPKKSQPASPQSH